MGVSRRKMNGCEYWLTRIVDNNNKNLQKLLSISKLGNVEASNKQFCKGTFGKNNLIISGNRELLK